MNEEDAQKLLKKDFMKFIEYEIANSYLNHLGTYDWIANLIFRKTKKKYNRYLKLKQVLITHKLKSL